ncbi:hypothetical protein [Picosynechococcus sp. PCC 73109]|uniref:hypothetical protein n=1 Tax=Picosynechococcus sp. PCC 73109 TaxID=374982 RepID=UPI0007458A2D|nr:hypothetical protein [Picosynechococcus sp. PCC 73109]AMA09218.1 hypothetical protein AWQ23_07755 [Picosynechococcus sp. PCC 73109]
MLNQLDESILAHNDNRERRRQFVVKAVFFIYFLSLLEGPLRKWFLPGLAGPLTLLRDPFVIALYAYCLLNGLILRKGIASLWLKFAVFTSAFGLLQYLLSGYSLEGWMLGVRTYWLYLPLAFVIAVTFRPPDVLRFLKLNLWIAVPYAFLVATQYSAGAAAFINRGVGGDESATVGVAQGIIRPFGLFTYTTPNTEFTIFMVVMLVAIYLCRLRDRPNPIALFTMATAVATMAVLTGSRYIFFAVVSTLGITTLGLLKADLKARTLIKVIVIVAFVIFAGWLVVNIFPDMFAAMGVRIESASRSEGSLWNRVYYSSFTFLDALQTSPILGHGIGAGAPGVTRFLGLPQFIYGESDTQRNINELGVILGSMFLLLRWFTGFWLLKIAIQLTRVGLPMVLPLAGYVVLPFTLGQITTSPIMSFLPWICVGMILAYQNAAINLLPPAGIQSPEFKQ